MRAMAVRLLLASGSQHLVGIHYAIFRALGPASCFGPGLPPHILERANR
jgi:hypothetical protein